MRLHTSCRERSTGLPAGTPGMRSVPSMAPILLVAGAVGLAAPAAQRYEVVTTESRAVIYVDKAGAFSTFAGHTHQVEAPIRGTLSVDPDRPERAAVALEIPTAALRVTGDGEPIDDVPEVQRRMVGADVLDAARYPTISFRSTTTAVQERDEALDILVTGDLTLHGHTRRIEVPVHAKITPATITARGTFSVRQTDFDITPVKAAGGLVSVKDELKIRFTLVARQAGS